MAGLPRREFFRGKDAIVSGPAGGVVGMAETAREAGFDHVIGFDMGGTSTDVSRFDGTFERVYETEVAGVRLRVPMMAIHTVAAGGGSILHYDGARFRVGPDSAGADPGPRCYRRGGPLAVTDANVMVGKLRREFFPHLFGPGADEPLDAAGRARRISRNWRTSWAMRRKRSRTASSASPSRTWRTPSSAFPSRSGYDCAALCAQLFRRRGRAACVSGGRRARHDAHFHPSVFGRACRLMA